MKQQNLIAFLLGILVAGLLWQFYLKPKYLIKAGDEEVLAEIYQADMAALNDATDDIEGEVLFKDYGEGAEFKDDIINSSSAQDEQFDFHSTANKEPDFFEQASRGPVKETEIIIDNEDPVMHPSAIGQGQVESSADSADMPNRITMIGAPVKYTLIANESEYKKYQSANKGKYPKVDFKKNRVVFVESDSALSNGFFETAGYTQDKDAVTVKYKVNILGADKRPERAAYVLVPVKGNIVLQQVK